MQARWVVLGMILISGCGNPVSDRFAVGDRAILVTDDGKMEVVVVSPARPLPHFVPVGTEVTVVADDDHHIQDSEWREVTVNIKTTGEAAKVTRRYLRPAK